MRSVILPPVLTVALCLSNVSAEVLPPPAIIESAQEFSPDFPAINAVNLAETDYASQGKGLDTFLVFDFGQPRTFNRILAICRNSPALGDLAANFTLSMDNGASTASVTRTAVRGVSYIHDLGASYTAGTVRLDVDTLGGGGAVNTGFMEVLFLNTPAGSSVVEGVTIIDSAAAFSAAYAVTNAIDGEVGRNGTANLTNLPEYASATKGVDTYIDFDLGAVTPVSGFDWFDRVATLDRTTSFDLIFSTNNIFGDDDDVIRSFTNDAAGMAMSSTFAAPVSARYVRYDVTGIATPNPSNAGLNEMVFYRTGSAAPEPLIHLPFDETAGLSAANSGSIPVAGSLINFTGDDTQWQAGRIGGAVSFNPLGTADDDVVVVSDPAIPDFSIGKKFSAACWVKADPSVVQESGGGIICRGAGGGGEQFCLDIFNGNYRFYIWTGGVPNTAFNLPTTVTPNGEWQHLAITYNQAAGRMRIYVNGIEAAAGTPPPNLLSSTADIAVGSRAFQGGWTLNFQGLIDDVRIYNRALTPQDILALMALAPEDILPPLSVVKTANGYIVSWPQAVTGWVLEESASLDAAVWATSQGVAGNALQVTDPAAGRLFYRLRRE